MSAYGLQAWHEYVLHHHDHCCEQDSGEETPSQDDCQLCDFVFYFDLPEEGLQVMRAPAMGRTSLAVTPSDPLTCRSTARTLLRGPPLS